jgi:hypothetical protein
VSKLATFIAPPVYTSIPAPEPGLIPGDIFLSTTHLGALARVCCHSVLLFPTNVSQMEA